MNIISSSIIWNLPQADGTSVVRLEAIDDQGNVYDGDLVFPPDMDLNARLAQFVTDLEAQ